MVVIGTPEGAATMFRAEGKYPVRCTADKHINWIVKSIDPDMASMPFA